MRNVLMATTLLGALALAGPSAMAEGCGKGAAVGGLIGHETGSGHAVAGAAGGCAVGHHEAKKEDKNAAQQQKQSAGEGSGSSQRGASEQGSSNSGSANGQGGKSGKD
jgi:hypothetical protein